jgi:O-antigen ligase
MIRLSALWFVVAGVAIYTWKDWYKGLCGLVLLLGILEYPDVPKSMFGITGLNFFNLLLMNVLVAWTVGRSRERLTWDLPNHLTVLLTLYVGVILVGFYRMFTDRGLMAFTETTGSIVAEYLINTLKWIIPGLLLFDGCRSRERLRIAAFALVGAYVFLAVMVVKVMPLGSAFLSGGDLQRLALKLMQSRIGYHRVTLSMMLGGAAWALIASAPLISDRRLRKAIPLVSLGVVYAQSLTGGRGGIVTLIIVGTVLAALRWRKVFLVAPVVVVMFLLLVPSAVDRLLEGIGRDPFKADTTTVDQYELTSGRNLIWPYVIAQIEQRPMVGWGRQAMLRTGTVTFLQEELKEDFGHPHNAYLETLLDNGIVGFIPVIGLFLTLLFHALRLFLERRSALCASAGGMAAALILALMVAGMSSQSFYPVEGTFEMWVAIGLMMRLSVERKRALATLRAAQPSRPAARFGVAAAADPRTADLDALIFNGAPGRGVPASAPARVNSGFSGAWPAAAGSSWRSQGPTAAPSSPARFRF